MTEHDQPTPAGADQPEGTRRTRISEAAFSAEYATGDQERSRVSARRNIGARLVIITVGTVVTLVGLGMLVLPGPGIVVVLVGLGILAQELPWAERLLSYAKDKAKVDKVKQQPLWVRGVLVAFTATGIGASIV
jgi:uncharacterized protein (TIGR02611 family)